MGGRDGSVYHFVRLAEIVMRHLLSPYRRIFGFTVCRVSLCGCRFVCLHLCKRHQTLHNLQPMLFHFNTAYLQNMWYQKGVCNLEKGKRYIF